MLVIYVLYGPHCEKPVTPVCSATETSSKIELLHELDLDYMYTFHKANNKDADQTAWIRRMICPFAVRMLQNNLEKADPSEIERTYNINVRKQQTQFYLVCS